MPGYPSHTLPDPNGWRPFELLTGVRVLDLTSSIAGPYATMLLADLGAEVAKVESGAGDDTRQWGPPFLDDVSLWFASVNRNKASVLLDYRTPAGHATLLRLVAAADVVMLNLRPRTAEKLRLDAPSLTAIRPDLVYCSITGFGLTGARRDMPSYDLIAEGYGAIMDLTGEADGPPQKVGTAAADLLAGMDAAFAVVAALLDRQRTGHGHVIDVSLAESMAKFVTPRIVSYLGSGTVPHRSGGRDSVIAIYQVFETADLPLTLGLGNDRIFERFCRIVDRPQWATEPRYSSNAARRAGRPELVAKIQQILVQRSRSDWLATFEAGGVPAGPINTVEQLAADEHLRERGLLFGTPAGPAGPIPHVGTGWHLDGEPNGRASSPPPLGSGTDRIIGSWLGDIADSPDPGGAPGQPERRTQE
jgi:crotonobetainyl-CoA:carnitine CoA-transferase CaiB-like acyl-CoA transferase